MSTSIQSFECHVAKRKVNVQIEMKLSRSDLPPGKKFKNCDGLETCGVRCVHPDGSLSFNWSNCPIYRSMMTD